MKSFVFTLLITFTLSLITCAETPAERKPPTTTPVVAQPTEPKNITPDELEKLAKDNPKIVILDIRTPIEYQEGHIAGAINFNAMDEKFDADLNKLDKSTPLVIYSGTSGRSTRTLPKLVQLKFLQIYHLEPGFRGWQSAGKPSVK